MVRTDIQPPVNSCSMSINLALVWFVPMETVGVQMWLHPVLKTIWVLDVLMKEFRTGVKGLFNKAFPSLTGKQNPKSLSQKCNGQISPCSDVCEELVWEELRSHPGLSWHISTPKGNFDC